MDTNAPMFYARSVTPFDADGKLDEAALRTHLRFLADGGVGVYLASYGSGEGQLLRREELQRLYMVGAEELRGRVPVYAAGLGFTEMDYVIELALEAAATGVDAVQTHPPWPGPTGAQRPTLAEIECFFTDVLDAVRTTVLLTNQMAMLGYEVPVEVYAKLVERYDQVIGIDCTHPDIGCLARLIDAVGARVGVRSASCPSSSPTSPWAATGRFASRRTSRPGSAARSRTPTAPATSRGRTPISRPSCG